MIQIGDKIISRELFENHFICDLSVCHGNCCVFGDSGAPLESEEADKLAGSIEKLIPYLRRDALRAIEEQGPWVIDDDGDKVTPLIGREECAYVVFEDGIASCAIEKAFEDGIISYRKPVSCHLYPVRVSKLGRGIALNYHRWGICEPARILGKKEGVPVFRFLKDPIERVYGKEFYRELELVYVELTRGNNP
ncbi:MAG: DUF3109 family protein [Bacteroidota bacterium]